MLYLPIYCPICFVIKTISRFQIELVICLFLFLGSNDYTTYFNKLYTFLCIAYRFAYTLISYSAKSKQFHSISIFSLQIYFHSLPQSFLSCYLTDLIEILLYHPTFCAKTSHEYIIKYMPNVILSNKREMQCFRIRMMTRKNCPFYLLLTTARLLYWK